MTLSAAEGERLSRLEGAYEHLATKADVERVRTDVERVRTDVERVRSELKGMKWIIGGGHCGSWSVRVDYFRSGLPGLSLTSGALCPLSNCRIYWRRCQR